jgi:hypothetical protein
MRQQLQLNPQIFSSSEEVLSHLSQLLPLWTASKNLPKGLVEISLSHRCLRKTQELHEYNFGLTLINHGADVVEDYFVEIEFPRAFLDETTGHIREVRERLTESHRFFRVTNDAVGRPLFPGDPVPVFTADYFVDQRLYRQHNGEFHEIVTATLYIPGQSPSGVEARMQDLQNF